jgi:hypothetical protein
LQQKKQLADFRREIEDLKRRFKLLAAELEQAAREQGWKGLKGKVDSLAELEELYCGLEEHLNFRQEYDAGSISDLLARAGRIVLAGGESSVDLEHFREKLKNYQEMLSLDEKNGKTATLRRQFLEGNHPLNALLRLLEEDLPFREAEEMFEAAAAEFGTSLALAAARGSLVLKEEQNGGDTTFPVAPAAAAATGDKRPLENFPELLYKLIREGKLSPAFWLAAYYEQEYGTAPVPSWLIKALEAAAVVRNEEGAAAEWLSYLYRKHDFAALTGGETGGKLAFNLLVFSALFRPALVAPGSGALSILFRRHDLPKELKSLVAAAASGSSGTESKAVWKREMEFLSRDVQSWSKQNRKLTLASPLASQLWDIMLEEGGLLYRLLQPMLVNDGETLEDIRELVDFLRERDNLKKELGRLYREIPGVPENMEIFHIPGSWQVINRLKSALKLAERYVKLYERAAEGFGKDNNSRAEEICRLLEPARKELKQLAHRYGTDHLLETALVVTGRALDSVEKYFQEKTEVPVTPEEAASLEVEENPQLMLKPSWKPQKKTVERMGKALLELLNDYFSSSLIREDMPSPGFYHKEEKSAIPADLDKLCRNELLTPQEREFIQNTIKSLQNN